VTSPWRHQVGQAAKLVSVSPRGYPIIKLTIWKGGISPPMRIWKSWYLLLLVFLSRKFICFVRDFHFWEQIERFLRKKGNRVYLWVEDTAGEEVAHHKTVWFVKLDTWGDKWLRLIFFQKKYYGLKTYLEAFMSKGPVFLKKTLSCGVSAFPDRYKSAYLMWFFLIYTEDSTEDTLWISKCKNRNFASHWTNWSTAPPNWAIVGVQRACEFAAVIHENQAWLVELHW